MISTRRRSVFVVLLALSFGCHCGDSGGGGVCADPGVPFDVGDPNGHPSPLGAGPTEARAGRIAASDLPPTPDGLGTWRGGDFVLANDRVAMVIEDAGDSDLYDPWGGKPVGFAHVANGQLVDPSDFGEILFFVLGPSTVVTEHVGVVNDGSDGQPAIVRAEGRIHAIPFVSGLIGIFWLGETYRDVVTRFAIDYVLEPSSEHVDVYTRLRHSDRVYGVYANGVEAHGFMYSDRLRLFQPEGIGFSSDSGSTNPYLAMVDPNGVGYAFEVPGVRLSRLPSASGFAGSRVKAEEYPPCEEVADYAHHYARIHIGGPDADALLDVVARSRGEATRAITGRVESSIGTGLAGVRVHVVDAADETQYLTRTTTDANGDFVVHVPASTAVNAYAYVMGQALVGPVAVSASATTTMLTVPAPAMVHVDPAEDQNGDPIPYKLQVLPRNATTIPLPPSDRWGEELPTTGRLHLEFALAGEALDLPLPPGDWQIVATRGFRYEPFTANVTVASGDAISVSPVLTRSVDTPGVFCADFHIHTRRSNDSADHPVRKLRAGLAEDLDIAVRSDHEYVEAWDDLLTGELGSGAFAIGVTSVELTTMEKYGHFGVLPVEEDPSLPNGGTPLWQEYPTSTDYDRAFRTLTPSELFARVHGRSESPIVIVNHPLGNTNFFGYADYDPATGTADPTRWSDDFEAIEVFNDQNWVGARDGTVRYWLSFLNRGVRVPAVGSSDTHSVAGSPMGYDRTCIDFGPDGITAIPQDPAARLGFGYVLRDAVAEGRSAVNGGIFVEATVAGVGPGRVASGLGATTNVHIRVRAAQFIDVDAIDVVVDGQTVGTIDVTDPLACTQVGVLRCELDYPIDVATANGYVVVAAYGDAAMEPMMRGRIPFGVSNPIYLAR